MGVCAASSRKNMEKVQNSPADARIETHPWPPFVPEGARALILGTFPPGSHRWAMDFFYPNPTNDFWKVMGLIFKGSAEALYDAKVRKYHREAIEALLRERGIAMGDSAYRVRRLQGNASDKFLEIVEPVDLEALAARMPHLQAIATTGEKAGTVVAQLTQTPLPAIGRSVVWHRHGLSDIQIWRLPSTSRAYPLPLERKAQPYAQFFEAAGCLSHDMR